MFWDINIALGLQETPNTNDGDQKKKMKSILACDLGKICSLSYTESATVKIVWCPVVAGVSGRRYF